MTLGQNKIFDAKNVLIISRHIYTLYINNNTKIKINGMKINKYIAFIWFIHFCP